jgi:hypothetical protein
MSEKPVKLSAEHSSRTKPLAVPKRIKKKIQLRDDYVLEDFYSAVRNNRLDSIHVPHSDVFFVKAAMEHRLNIKFKLKDVEAAMRAEGWNESRVLVPHKQKVLAND